MAKQRKERNDEPIAKKNPASRIGTARLRRVSQITKKFPSKRLIARRSHNTKKGYFPNPDKRAGKVFHVEAAVKKFSNLFRPIASFSNFAMAKEYARALTRKLNRKTRVVD